MVSVARSEVLVFAHDTDVSLLEMTIFAPSDNELAIQRLEPGEAAEFGEEPLQILEGLRYEYELCSSAFRLKEEIGAGIVIPSSNPHLAHCGTLSPGLNTGKLVLQIVDVNGVVLGVGALEVRPKKLGHREHYRLMLEDITEACVDLALELRAPTTTKLAPSPGNSSATIHQRFAFLRALISSRLFRDAMHRISTHPHSRWEPEERVVDIRKGFRPNGKSLRGIASSSRRLLIPMTHPLHAMMHSLPERISSYHSNRTLDTKENRFIKFALQTFIGFLNRMTDKLDELAADRLRRGLKRNEADWRLRTQISVLESELLHALDLDVFRNLSEIDILPLGSPVLQRKAGYREIYQAWLRFDMAARLTWDGGDDVYGAGQRNIATLYEYWVFFKLLSIVANFFDFVTPPVETLIEPTADGFGIKLKTGEHLAFDAVKKIHGRSLKVQFGYNRSFKRNAVRDVAGSWTEIMRPDYTLSLWPSDFSAVEAEKQELMVHVHFDAKYRIDNLEDIFGKESESFSAKEPAVDGGKYKRDDLLKMHAYRDAIRRTQGAYVIYPGDAQKQWEQFNEILPGLGAFPLRPGNGENVLIGFIQDLVDNICDRATQRERISFHNHKVHNEETRGAVYGDLPEIDVTTGVRLRPLPERMLLISMAPTLAYFNFSKKRSICAVELGPSGLDLQVTPNMFSADYVLVCTLSIPATTMFAKIRSNGARIIISEVLIQLGFPDVTPGSIYLAWDIEPAPEFEEHMWDVSSCTLPLAVPLTTAMEKYMVNNSCTTADGKNY